VLFETVSLKPAVLHTRARGREGFSVRRATVFIAGYVIGIMHYGKKRKLSAALRQLSAAD
jgi:hypothetical protein